MQKFKINELRPHPRNNEFFDDMSGEKWQEFLESIKTSGVIEPIVVTQDKVIVSGHQRVRACKELGIEEILAEVKVYDNEDDIIKDLLETNIRQRGDIGGSTVKLGRRIKELERIYGVKHGNNQFKKEDSPNGLTLSQEDLAQKLGINLKTLKRAKTIANLPQEIQDLVEQGNITPSTASRVISKLSDEEQAELIESLPVSKKLTQKEVEGYIEKLKEKDNQIAGYEKKVEKLKSLENEKSELEKQISDLKNQEPKEIIKEVIPDDYDKIKLSNKAYKDECKELQSKYDNTLDEIAKLKHQIKELSVNTKSKTEFNQKIIDTMNRFTDKVNSFITDNGGFVWIAQHISELPLDCDNTKTTIKQFLSAIKSITDWANDTNAYVEQVMTEIKNTGYDRNQKQWRLIMPKTENKNKITISDHYFFIADEYQYILYNCCEREKIDVKTKKPTGEIGYYENVVGYYSTVDSLIKGCKGHALRTKILNGELETINDVLKESQRLQDELEEILNKVELI